MELAVESVGKDIVGSGSKPSKVQLKSCHVCYKSPCCKVHCTSGAPTTIYDTKAPSSSTIHHTGKPRSW